MIKEGNTNLFFRVFIFWFIILFFFRLTGFFFSFLILLIPIFIIVIVGMNLYYIVKRNELTKKYLKDHSEQHNKFFITLIVCSAKILSADGRIENIEVQTVKNFFMFNFGFQQKALAWVEETLNAELKHNRPVVIIALEVNKIFDYSTKLALMDFLFRLAMSDSLINEQEKKVLEEFAFAFGINVTDLTFLRTRYYANRGHSNTVAGKGRSNYLQILGLTEEVSQEDIKSAYRQLVKKFHPDVVAHLGDDVRLASEKRMKEIQEAYDFLKDT